MKLILVLFIITGCSTHTHEQQSKAKNMRLTKEIIIQKEKELIDAMSASNVTQLDLLIANQMIFINQTGLVMSKSEDLKVHESGLLKISKLETSDQKIIIFDDTAVVSVSVDLHGTYSGEAFSGKFKYGRTWKVLNGKPQVISAQCSVRN